MGLGLGVDCPADEGYHFNEFDVYAVVINPETGEILPDGEEGELVYTTLFREAMPLIRYRSHDIGRLIFKPCKIGSSLKSLSHVTRRLESIVKVGKEQVLKKKIIKIV